MMTRSWTRTKLLSLLLRLPPGPPSPETAKRHIIKVLQFLGELNYLVILHLCFSRILFLLHLCLLVLGPLHVALVEHVDLDLLAQNSEMNV